MNKRLAALLNKRTTLVKEARSLAEAVDLPAEELEEKTNDVISRMAEIEAAIEQLKKLLAVTEDVEEEAEEVEEAIEKEAKEEEAEADPTAPTEESRSRSKARGETRTAFYRALHTGKVESRSITTTSAGMLIPTAVEQEVIQAVASSVFIREIATARTIAGNTKVPAFTGVSNFKALAENDDYPTVDLTVGGATLAPKKIGGIAVVSEETLWLAAQGDAGAQADIEMALADGLSNAEELYFLTGAATAPKALIEPRGIFTDAPVRVTAAAAALTAQDFIDLFYSLDERWRNNGTWIMSGDTAALLRGLEDTAGNPLLQPAGLYGATETILGRPFKTSAFAPKVGTKNVSVVFGDMRHFRIGDRKEKFVQVLRERYADKGQIGLKATVFLDSGIAVPNAFGAIKHA